MKPRSELSASDISELHGWLDGKLSSVGIPTQPEVASQILHVVGKRDVQVGEFAKVIRADAALTGRLLRLANSASCAQRTAVTSPDRACAMLGVEKLKSFTLGFYLSRAAATDPSTQLSRTVWTQSVFRACLASELARTLVPDLASEAFIIGLMLDAGLPLMPKLAGPAFTDALGKATTPTKIFLSEFRQLPFTHVDVITVLMGRWKLPDILSKPVEWHHVQPNATTKADAAYQLRRIAYSVGLVELANEPAKTPAGPISTLAVRALGLDERALSAAVRRASDEYAATSGLFARVADSIGDLDQLAARVHHQLTDLLDRATGAALKEHDTARAPTFKLGGLRLELRGEPGGDAMACIFDSGGAPLVTHRFRPEGADADTIRDAIGLTAEPDDEESQINLYLHSLAA